MALVQVDFFSTSLMRTVTMSAVVPADRASIETDGSAHAVAPGDQRPFKTLYLLHGIYGNHSDWIAHTRIQELAEARNLAVIMPSGDNSFYNDRINGSRYGEFIGRELLEFSRKLFRLSDARKDTFIGGLSMGGYGATVNALRHPEAFSHVIALSSGYRIDEPTMLEATYDAPGIIGNRAYNDAVLGPLESVRGGENDYDALAARVAAGDAPRPRFFMACGTEDGLLGANRAYRETLQGLDFDVEYHEGPGQHNWKFWDEWIERALGWLPLDEAKAPVSSGNVNID